MKVEETHMGHTYRFRTREEEQEALLEIEKIISPYNLSVEMPPQNILSRGVQGDEPTYTRVVILKGKHPGNDILSQISTKITNAIPINRVLFDFNP